MLKKWIAILLPVAVLGLSGCASVSDTDTDTDSTMASSAEKKVTKKDCDKVTTTGSRLGRCR